jgi:hypothetical protein
MTKLSGSRGNDHGTTLLGATTRLARLTAKLAVFGFVTVACDEKKDVGPKGAPSAEATSSDDAVADAEVLSSDDETLAARGCNTKPLIIAACGNAFGACSSGDDAKQMANVVAGLGVQVVAYNWGGSKWQPQYNAALKKVEQLSCGGKRKIMFSGRSAGGWLAAIVGTRSTSAANRVAGFISYYGPLDLPTLWQKDQWGKQNSPRGPIKYMMPWGLPGCTDCSDPFPQGDAWTWNVDDENDPSNHPKMTEAALASPYHYFNESSPPMFATQGTEDGIIGQYGGISQAERMYRKLGGRAQDRYVKCQGVAHGYAFNAGCAKAQLRQWICSTLGLSKGKCK